MRNGPTKEELARIPKLYATEGTPAKDKIIHMHFFIGDCDWYVAEFDSEDVFFCFAILNGDFQCAEWGYASLAEMEAINISGLEIDRDLDWEPVPACRIKRISGLMPKRG